MLLRLYDWFDPLDGAGLYILRLVKAWAVAARWMDGRRMLGLPYTSRGEWYGSCCAGFLDVWLLLYLGIGLLDDGIMFKNFSVCMELKYGCGCIFIACVLQGSIFEI